jgi:hypothetical protein
MTLANPYMALAVEGAVYKYEMILLVGQQAESATRETGGVAGDDSVLLVAGVACTKHISRVGGFEQNGDIHRYCGGVAAFPGQTSVRKRACDYVVAVRFFSSSRPATIGRTRHARTLCQHACL